MTKESRRAVAGPTVWTRSTLKQEDWLVDLDDEGSASVEAIAEQLRASGTTLDQAKADSFQVPGLSGLTERLQAALFDGPGVAVVRGWRVEQWGDDLASLLYWGLGSLIGSPRPQNTRGDRVKLVTRPGDAAPTHSESARRGSRSNQEIGFHTENGRPPVPPRIVGLLCLRAAAHGGESLVISGHTVHNEILGRSAPALERLYEGYHFARSEPFDDGRVTDVDPVFARRGDRLAVRYNRYWMDRGHDEAGAPLTQDPRARSAVDAFEEVLADPDLALRHLLQPGEAMFVNNDVVLHSRTAFTDHDDARRRRCLVRLWLD